MQEIMFCLRATEKRGYPPKATENI